MPESRDQSRIAARRSWFEVRVAAASSRTRLRLSRHLSYGRALALATAVGAVLRLALLARQPIGYDEDFTAVAVHASPARMIEIVAHDSAPPLFYILEKLAVAAASVVPPGGAWAAASLRIVPALAGIALIPLLAAMGRRIGGDRAGLWTAAFVAVLPTTVLLSEFARMYGLAAALAVAAALLLWRAIEQPSLRGWVWYGAVAAAAVWTDYFVVVALAGIVVAGLWLRPSRRVAAAAFIVTAISVASVGPWLAVARAQLEHSGQGFWIQPLGPGMIGGTLAQLFMGPPVNGGIPWGRGLIGLEYVAVAAGCVALAGAVIAWRRFDPESRRAAGFCLLACSGVVMLAAVSLWRPMLDARYASVMWLPLFALCGAGLAAMSGRVASLVVLAVAVPALALGAVTTHSETSSLVADVDAAVIDHDLVDTDWSHYLILLDQSSPQVRARLHILAPEDPPWFVGTAAYPPAAVLHAVPPDVIANRGRIFWIAEPGADPPLLPAGYRAVSGRCVIEACLTTYAPD